MQKVFGRTSRDNLKDKGNIFSEKGSPMQIPSPQLQALAMFLEKMKLTSVVTDITGVSGRAILNALLQGQRDPQVLAELARGRLRAKRDQLVQALQGTLREHHCILLTNQLRHLDFLDRQVAELDRESGFSPSHLDHYLSPAQRPPTLSGTRT